MSTLQHEVQTVVAALFERFPALVGFSVRDADGIPERGAAALIHGQLVIADVGTFPFEPEPLHMLGEIALPLADLMEQQPAAREVLCGRTFARSVQ